MAEKLTFNSICCDKGKQLIAKPDAFLSRIQLHLIQFMFIFIDAKVCWIFSTIPGILLDVI